MDYVKVDLAKLTSLIPSVKSDPKWVLARIEGMLEAWPETMKKGISRGFIISMAAGLEQYPPEILEYVTDPRTGVQRKLDEKGDSWPPTLAHMVEACVAEIQYREKVSRYSNLPPALPRLPRPKYSADQSYEAMVKKHGRPTGPFEAGREHNYEG